MPVEVIQIRGSADYSRHIRRGADLLTDGNVVVLPTETVYGAAALLASAAGRERLRAIRPGDKKRPLTPHLAHREQAERFLGPTSDLARRMMHKLWPGPVGLQFDVPAPRRREVAEQLQLAETDLYDGESITLRCPDHQIFTAVASAVSGPLAATLAGDVGRVNGADLANDLDGKVELIFDAGPPRFSKPSTLLKISGDGYQVVRSGVYDERTIRRLLKTTILFVCSGNTCRSPMAEAIARKILLDKFGGEVSEFEKRGIDVVSAGSMAMPGARATPEAADAVKAIGADLSRHRSRPLTIELINQADVIYTMSRDHSHAVTGMVPSAHGKVHTLDPKKDIDDPIGGPASLYNDLAGQLKILIDARLRERSLP